MVAHSDPPRVSRRPGIEAPVATLGAVAGGALVALASLAVPTRLLEALVVRSGVAALVNAAQPPLGLTARLLLAAGGGGLVAAVGWAMLVLLVGERRLRLRWRGRAPAPTARRPAADGPRVPSVRRADSHPDAPPRPPILAGRDLGRPFLSVVAPFAAPAAGHAEDERSLPADLDTALAAVDPDAIPEVPREPVRPVSSLAAASLAAAPRAAAPSRPVPLAPGERIDSVELGADVRDRPDSIEALLARLERGTKRRQVATFVAAPGPAAPAAEQPSSGSLEETLGNLRRLAVRR